MRTLALAAVLLTPLLVCADTVDDQLNAEAQKLNSRAPMMADATTRLDNAVYHDRIFVYHYTVLNHASSDFSPSQKRKDAQLLTQQVVNRACTASALRPLLD